MTTKPDWATHENACKAAAAVLVCGGTDERAAEAYRRTLLGIGEPASALEIS